MNMNSSHELIHFLKLSKRVLVIVKKDYVNYCSHSKLNAGYLNYCFY